MNKQQHPPAIVFYKSAMCPRCLLVGRELYRLRQAYPDLKVKEVDVARHPLRAWREGIRMIPALRSGSEHLAGVFLSAELIRRFVTRHLARRQFPEEIS